MRKQLNNCFYEAGSYRPVERSSYIVDAKIEICYSWWVDCNFIWEFDRFNRLQPWSKIDIDKNDETFIAKGLWWKKYLYVLRDYQDSDLVVNDLAMSLDSLPLELINERQRKIRNNEIDGYHTHSYSYRGQIRQNLDHSKIWSSKHGNQLESWFWKGSGLWCKYGPKSRGIKNIRSFIGDDYVEMRPFWEEIIHCLSRGKDEKPISISLERDDYENAVDIFALKQKELLLKGSEFKILQLSDLHFGKTRLLGSTSNGVGNFLHSDLRHIQLIEAAIRYDRPDLVTITGDLFVDDSHVIDFETQTLKIVSPMIKNGIPFVFAWGDEVKQVSKSLFLKFISSLPFCLNKFVEDGSTNIMLPIASADSSQQIGTIYSLDSDIDLAQKFLNEQPISPLSLFNLAFQHFPLKEFRPDGSFALIGQYEEKGSLDYLADTKSLRNLLGERNVRALSCGHDHSNDCCIFSEGKQQQLTNDMWLCYLGVTGYDNEYQSGVRLFKIDSGANEITSWKRKIGDPAQVCDYQYIWRNSAE